MNEAQTNLRAVLDRKRKLLSSDNAAAYCSLGFSTLAKLRMRGDGPRYCKLGGRVLYDPDDLDDWIDASKRLSTAA